MNGKVYLIGAGPGDPGLITVKGMACLSQADVVIYDRLIDDGLLQSARPDAALIYVGKSAKVHAREQHQIDQLLIEHATEGKTVARLKGGDPFVLGRGGEECEALAAAGIAYEVVAGITSAVASPAYAGIPVTHRQVASSFAVITGHEDPAKEISSINWEHLSTGVDTLVFLMGMGNLSQIAEKLIRHGRPPDTPVALIRHGTTLNQQTLVADLATIAEKAARSGFEPPVAIVVGEVVRLRQTLAWFENRPLFGKRVLVTRARAQASALSRLLAARGARPIELPAIEIQPVTDPSELDRAILDLSGFDWVVFTSANGVDALWDRLVALGRDSRQFGRVKIGAIGPATAQALERRGLYPDFMPAEYTSQGILSGLAERDIGGCRILLPRADIAPKDLVAGLAELGARPADVTAYLTRQPAEVNQEARQLLREGKIDIITFTSSSTVKNLLDALGDDQALAGKATIACIGPVTATAAREAGLTVEILAEEQTIPGLVAAIESQYQPA